MFFSKLAQQFERLSEQLAPVPTDPAHRFKKAVQSGDTNFAISLLSPTPPPLADGTVCSPLDPLSTVLDKQKGSFAIHCAAEYSQISIVQSLISEFGVSPEQFDAQGNTPLHYACSSAHPAALDLVKLFVIEYKVSPTVKNAMGQTPYDVSKQDRIRQYLLPIQLQKETQECLDNGGQGLPPGIDLGGLSINRHLPPPPMAPTMGSVPPTIASIGKYAVPSYGMNTPNDMTPPVQQPFQQAMHNPQQLNSSPNMPNYMNSNSALNQTSNTFPDPSNSPESAFSNPINESSLTNTNNSMPVASVDHTHESPLATTPATVADSKPINISATDTDVNSIATTGLRTDTIANNPIMPTTKDTNTVSQAKSTTEQSVAPDGNSTTFTLNSGYARRGFSTAAVLPSSAKYRPDGFHSSSSDVSLQQKYGHDASVTGPPSGQYTLQNIGPPPSGVASTGIANSGYNSGPPIANQYSAYASSGYGRPRYPTYDAVSNTVGTVQGYNSYSQPTMQTTQYNIYTPANSQANHYQYMGSDQNQYHQYAQDTGYAHNQYSYAAHGQNSTAGISNDSNQQQQMQYNYNTQQDNMQNDGMEYVQPHQSYNHTLNHVSTSTDSSAIQNQKEPSPEQTTAPSSAQMEPSPAKTTELAPAQATKPVTVQSSPASASHLFSSPPSTGSAMSSSFENSNLVAVESTKRESSVTSASDLFSSPSSVEEPLATEKIEETSTVENVIVSSNENEDPSERNFSKDGTDDDDDLLPPPTLSTELPTTNNDTSDDIDELPPPPMIDISLS